MTAEYNTHHFRMRRRQVILASIVLMALLAGIAVVRLQTKVAGARLEQQWGLWRDDHCKPVAGRLAHKRKASLYDHAHTGGVPATWQCSNGLRYVLANSDKPP